MSNEAAVSCTADIDGYYQNANQSLPNNLFGEYLPAISRLLERASDLEQLKNSRESEIDF